MVRSWEDMQHVWVSFKISWKIFWNQLFWNWLFTGLHVWRGEDEHRPQRVQNHVDRAPNESPQEQAENDWGGNCKTKQDPVMTVFVSFVKIRNDETHLRFVSGHVRALRLRRRVRGHPGGPYTLRSRPSHRLGVSALGIWWICQILSVISTFAYKLREYMSTWYQSKGFGKVIKDDWN